ncbi:hypothetical protein [Gorillibacterium sp. sgz5001074]
MGAGEEQAEHQTEVSNRWKDAYIIIATVVVFTLLFAGRDASEVKGEE